MPRKAIRDYNTSFFHVMVQGIRKEYIFNEKEDIELYIRLIYTNMKKCSVKIIAYCVINNHAHLLTYTDDIEKLSKFMKCINTTYAMYYNKKYKKTGYVFRNRYRAEPIFNQRHLINCINYIHNNPVVANICNTPEGYHFSSANEYRTERGIIKESKNIFPEINILYDKQIDEPKRNYRFIDYYEEREYLDKIYIIEKCLKEKGIEKENINANKKYLEEIIVKLRKECNLTHQEIANELGISRVKVTRIINKY